MRQKRDRSLNAAGELKVYEPEDPSLRAYDRAVGTLSVGGRVVGHLASVVGEMRFPSREPWPWFVIIWLDGRKENPFEDYGPGWYVVRELDAGVFEHYGPSEPFERRVFGIPVRGRKAGPRTTFEYARLPPELAARRWEELGLVDTDF